MGSVQRRVDILGVRGVRRCGPTVKYGKSVADFEGRRHRDPNMEQLSIIDPSFTLEYRTRGTMTTVATPTRQTTTAPANERKGAMLVHRVIKAITKTPTSGSEQRSSLPTTNTADSTITTAPAACEQRRLNTRRRRPRINNWRAYTRMSSRPTPETLCEPHGDRQHEHHTIHRAQIA